MTKFGLQQEKGFSLVELAISVTIVGILLTAVVKGQDVLEAARVTAIVSQVQNFSNAVDNYKDAFGYYPGDDVVEPANCDVLSVCAAGDGNGFIEIEDGGSVDTDPDWDAEPGEDDETVQFWKHMAVVEMISDVQSAFDVGSNSDYAFGLSHPASPIKGGYDVFYDTDFQPNGVDVGQQGHFFRLSAGPLDDTVEPLVKTTMAKAIDRKLDDGMPYTGRVFSGGDDCVEQETAGSDSLIDFYNVDEQGRACVMFFKFGGRRK